MSPCAIGFRGQGAFEALWADKVSWEVAMCQCDSGFRGLCASGGLWADKESWESQWATVIVVLGG